MGSLVLIENLSAQETYGTKLHLEGAKVETPQAIVLAIGPAVDAAKYGFSVGDRVVVQGTCVPVPGNGKNLALVEPHTIKGVIVVEEEPALG